MLTGGARGRKPIEGRRAILTCLRIAGDGISQSELANRTGLTPAAICRLVSVMARDNWIHSTGQGQTTAVGGRPPTYLAMNADARFALVAYVSVHRVELVKVNLAFDIEPVKVIQKTHCMPVDQLVELLVTEYGQCISGQADKKRFCGMSVLLGGPVDHARGLIGDSYNVHTEPDGFALAEALRQRLRVPVVIDSEVSASLSGEMWSGAGSTCHHVAYVFYDDRGPVVSFCLNGELYRGGAGPAGQIDGFFFEKTPGEKYGYHEGRLLPAAWLSEEEKRQVPVNTFIELNQLARSDGANDPKVHRLLEQRLDLLARGMVNICNLICPEVIILGGHLVELDASSFEFIRQRVLHSAIRKIHVTNTQIVSGDLPFSKAVFIGGASYLLNKWFERSL